MKTVDRLPAYITRLLTDSRRVTKSDIRAGNTAFVALRTKVGDGHRYIESLYDMGLRTFIVNNDFLPAEDYFDEDTVFVTSDTNTLDFIIAEAGKRLSASRAKQIVITGSHGKTTAKELLYKAMLKAGIKVRRSPRTWNSAMGMTLGVFDCLEGDPEVIITESAIDAPGQAARVKPLLRPEIGIITSITDEHDEAFDSHADKVAEKVALVSGAKTIYYVDTDDELTRQLAALNDCEVIAASSISEIVERISGQECPPVDFSTKVEIRQIPDRGIMVIDSFTNDIESLPLSVALACQRRNKAGLTVFLGDFEGDREKAKGHIAENNGEVYFFDKHDSHFIHTLHRDDFNGKLLLIKGGTDELITFFDEARHDTSLQIDLDALSHNYNVYRRLLPARTGLIGMVKADAYGHGALEVAKTLQNLGADYLAVAVVDEAVTLRRSGITMPIIVLNPITNRFEALVQYGLEPTIFSIEELKCVEHGVKPYVRQRIPVHIKLDTGMHRVGFSEEDIPELAERLNASSVLMPSTIFSHLATADCRDKDESTHAQLKLFEGMAAKLSSSLNTTPKRHILNTAGIAVHADIAPRYELARLGIGLYGISPVKEGHDKSLRPVAVLTTTIIALHHYPEGTSIGYGGNAITKRPTTIATLPIGYADGIDRRLGNGRTELFINGIPCPTFGNICMDLMMIDVTEAVKSGAKVEIGSEVEIFGRHRSVADLAGTLGTIPYEILTDISPRVRRTYHFR